MDEFSIKQALLVLGLKRGASARALKSAYRKMARKHHPDKGGSSHDFKVVKAAYDYLVENGTTEKVAPPFYSVGLGDNWVGVTMNIRYVRRA